jgi:hypothetical protein
MFGKKKIQKDRYIIAVKDYEATLKSMKEDKIKLPFDNAIYLKLLGGLDSKVDNLDDLKKFIKANNKEVKEYLHSWEGLISGGYTIMNVEYLEKVPSLDKLCSRDTVKFVCNA